MRCPDCEKFVPYDTDQEPEEDGNPELDDDGSFNATYTRRLACGECGGDLKEGLVEVAGAVSSDAPCKDGATHTWSLVSCNAQPTTGRRAYGVLCDVEAECTKCGVKVTDVEIEGDISPGEFEDVA
jgi:hypothetical protein